MENFTLFYSFLRQNKDIHHTYILPGIGIPSCKLATFVLQFLIPSAANEHTVIDSFHLAGRNLSTGP